MEYCIYHRHTSCPADLWCTAWGVCIVWSQDLTYWFSRNQTQRLSWRRFIYLFLRTCATARSQLVWDVSVFVFGMEHLVALFCYLRNKAAFRHVCVPADEARQEKQVYVPPLGSGDPTGNCLSGFSIAHGKGRRILPGWRPRSSSYLFRGRACANAAGSAMIGRCVTSGAGLAHGFAWTALGTLRQDGVIYLHSYIPDAYVVT